MFQRFQSEQRCRDPSVEPSFTMYLLAKTLRTSTEATEMVGCHARTTAPLNTSPSAYATQEEKSVQGHEGSRSIIPVDTLAGLCTVRRICIYSVFPQNNSPIQQTHTDRKNSHEALTVHPSAQNAHNSYGKHAYNMLHSRSHFKQTDGTSRHFAYFPDI